MMQKTFIKLENALDMLKGGYLGTVEEENANVVGRITMKMSLDTIKIHNIKEVSGITNGSPLTSIIIELFKYPVIDFNFYVTDYSFFNKYKQEKTIRLIKIIDMFPERDGRTIMEVAIGSDLYVIKAVDTVGKDTNSDGYIETPTQNEVQAFDGLPQALKPYFVSKYAHGRLYVGKKQSEFILMEKMGSNELGIIISDSNRDINWRMGLWVNAIKMLLKLHDHGWAHGDAHPGNILLTLDGTRMKWIDPERMTNLSNLNNKMKAALKIRDISLMLCGGEYVLDNIEGKDEAYHKLNWEIFHERLDTIKKSLNIDPKYPWLSDIIMFNNAILFTRKADGSYTNKAGEDMMKAIRNDPQYQIMDSIDFKTALAPLMDKTILKKTADYLIRQINKAGSHYYKSYNDDDFLIPYPVTTLNSSNDSKEQSIRQPQPNQALMPQQINHQHAATSPEQQQILPNQLIKPVAIFQNQSRDTRSIPSIHQQIHHQRMDIPPGGRQILPHPLIIPAANVQNQIRATPLILSIHGKNINITNKEFIEYAYANIFNRGFVICKIQHDVAIELIQGQLYEMFNTASRRSINYQIGSSVYPLYMLLHANGILQVGILNPDWTPMYVINLNLQPPHVLA